MCTKMFTKALSTIVKMKTYIINCITIGMKYLLLHGLL